MADIEIKTIDETKPIMVDGEPLPQVVITPPPTEVK